MPSGVMIHGGSFTHVAGDIHVLAKVQKGSGRLLWARISFVISEFLSQAVILRGSELKMIIAMNFG